jgi:hypothetical protein
VLGSKPGGVAVAVFVAAAAVATLGALLDRDPSDS